MAKKKSKPLLLVHAPNIVSERRSGGMYLSVHMKLYIIMATTKTESDVVVCVLFTSSQESGAHLLLLVTLHHLYTVSLSPAWMREKF